MLNRILDLMLSFIIYGAGYITLVNVLKEGWPKDPASKIIYGSIMFIAASCLIGGLLKWL